MRGREKVSSLVHICMLWNTTTWKITLSKATLVDSESSRHFKAKMRVQENVFILYLTNFSHEKELTQGGYVNPNVVLFLISILGWTVNAPSIYSNYKADCEHAQ